MSDDEALKRRMRKLLALAERGEGGERDNAERMLANLLAKHGLTLKDLENDQPTLRRFTWRTTDHRDILFQCVFRVLDVNNISYRQQPRRKAARFELTPAQYAELAELYERMTTAWNKERRELMLAFLWKHELFSSKAADSDPNDKPDYDLDQVLRKMRSLADAPLPKSRQLERDS